MTIIIARQTLERARIFLRLSEDLIADDREASAALLEAAIVFGRSVTLHLQKQLRHQPGFEEWYLHRRAAIERDPLSRLFLETRNFILKEGPARMNKRISVSLGVAVEISVALSVSVVRGRPWYRRQPKILWEDLRHAIGKRLAPLRPRLTGLASQGHTHVAGWLPTRSEPATESSDGLPAQRGDTWHFSGTDWQEENAVDLVGRYLDTLEALVREAEQEFSGGRDAETA